MRKPSGLKHLNQAGKDHEFSQFHRRRKGGVGKSVVARLLDAYGAGHNYLVVKNLGRGNDFSQLEASPAMARALEMGVKIITLAQLHEASMRKIDRQNTSFWAAIHNRADDDALGLLERQRIKNWLRKSYESFDACAKSSSWPAPTQGRKSQKPSWRWTRPGRSSQWLNNRRCP